MDLQRIILLGGLLFTVMLIWNAWQEDYVRPQQEQVATTERDQVDTPSLPTDGAPAGDVPTAEVPETSAADTPVSQTRTGLGAGERITVTTDVFRAEINAVGGDLRRIELLEYPVSVDQPDNPITLLNDRPGDLFVAQTGLLPAGTDGSPAPSHHARFEAEKSEYRLSEREDQLNVDLTWRENGIVVTKTYTFRRGDYLVDVGYTIENASGAPWNGHMYRQLQRTPPQDDGQFFIYTYTGGVIYSPEERYEKIDFDEMAEAPLNRTFQGGWAAMIQHYFLSAWVPPQDQKYTYYTKGIGNERILGMVGPQIQVAPGASETLTSGLYVGPKIQNRLEEIATGLELTVDYGILTFISKPLHWVLALFHSIFGNWGVAIILLTVLIKAVFYKLSEKSYTSMAHMRKVQPRLMAIKEKYGDDREKLNQAMMKLYKEEKINPLGGCLPILVQIPVFIALYWALLESVELRQAPFMLWIQDLSVADPYFVLPVLMGATMLIQHRLNPTPMDPIQARVMMLLPIVFTVFFAFFPAGLVLYWVVNNGLSILQQWYITRFVVKT
ncbi:membrane protein insertase YidC [Thiohalomonas denitrificans]|uniref:membrane protein insertase YidC n=1 Tax=Thiohalomonas denitrificans TaxID=415747 RepID=UPI0026EBA692|nr:membrane protein insertase YidC [Thiohalomonas denitrificans]